MSRVHQIRAATVVAFGRAQTANDRQFLGLSRQFRQMLADTKPGDSGFNFLELATILVAGLHVKRVGLAGSSGHPEQDTMAAAFRIISKRLCQTGHPAAQSTASDA